MKVIQQTQSGEVVVQESAHPIVKVETESTGPVVITDLADVSTPSNPTNGQVWTYQNGATVLMDAASGGGGGATSLPGLSDVDDDMLPSEGEVLTFSGTQWESAEVQIPPFKFEELTDASRIGSFEVVRANAINQLASDARLSVRNNEVRLGPTGGVATSLEFQDNAGGEYVRVKAPSSVSSSYTLSWPTAAGSSGDILRTDGSGNLSWVNATSGTYTPTVSNNRFLHRSGWFGGADQVAPTPHGVWNWFRIGNIVHVSGLLRHTIDREDDVTSFQLTVPVVNGSDTFDTEGSVEFKNGTAIAYETSPVPTMTSTAASGVGQIVNGTTGADTDRLAVFAIAGTQRVGVNGEVSGDPSGSSGFNFVHAINFTYDLGRMS